MKKSLPFLSPYLLLIFPVVMLLGLTLVSPQDKSTKELGIKHPNTIQKLNNHAL